MLEGQEAIRLKWDVCIKFANTEADKLKYSQLKREELANHFNYCLLNKVK